MIIAVLFCFFNNFFSVSRGSSSCFEGLRVPARIPGFPALTCRVAVVDRQEIVSGAVECAVNVDRLDVEREIMADRGPDEPATVDVIRVRRRVAGTQDGATGRHYHPAAFRCESNRIEIQRLTKYVRLFAVSKTII